MKLKIEKVISGFTLIELMVVVAIIGIIAAIGYPSYSRSILKANRSDAIVMLGNVSSNEERVLTRAGQYTEILGNLNAFGPESENGYYDLTVAINGAVKNVTADYEDAAAGGIATLAVDISCAGSRCYALAATAKDSQTRDTECLIITLDSVGRKRSYSKDGENELGDCW